MNKFFSKLKVLIIFATFAHQGQIQAVKNSDKSALKGIGQFFSGTCKSVGNGLSRTGKIIGRKCSSAKQWFDKQSKRTKRGIIGGGAVVVAVILCVLGRSIFKRTDGSLPLKKEKPAAVPLAGQEKPAADQAQGGGEAPVADPGSPIVPAVGQVQACDGAGGHPTPPAHQPTPVAGQGGPVIGQAEVEQGEYTIAIAGPIYRLLESRVFQQNPPEFLKKAIFGGFPTKRVTLGQFRNTFPDQLNLINQFSDKSDDYVLKWI